MDTHVMARTADFKLYRMHAHSHQEEGQLADLYCA